MGTTAEKLHTPSKDELRDSMKHVGEAGAEPFLDLLDNYKDSVVDVIDAVEEGLRAAEQSLQGSSSRANKLVADQFASGAEWIRKIRQPIANGQRDDLLNMIEEQGAEHQEATFAASVIAGIVLGRIGRYASGSSRVQTPSDENRAQPVDFNRESEKGETHDTEFKPRGATPERENEPDTYSIAGGYRPKID